MYFHDFSCKKYLFILYIVLCVTENITDNRAVETVFKIAVKLQWLLGVSAKEHLYISDSHPHFSDWVEKCPSSFTQGDFIIKQYHHLFKNTEVSSSCFFKLNANVKQVLLGIFSMAASGFSWEGLLMSTARLCATSWPFPNKSEPIIHKISNKMYF